MLQAITQSASELARPTSDRPKNTRKARATTLLIAIAVVVSACGAGSDDASEQQQSAAADLGAGSNGSQSAASPLPELNTATTPDAAVNIAPAPADQNAPPVAMSTPAPASTRAPAPASASVPANTTSSDLPGFDVVSNGRTLYVSNSGSNGNSGLSQSSPLQSIQTAMDMAQPGDTVLVRQGTYSYPQNPGGDVVVVRNSGKPGAWISLKAYPGETPVIQSVNWSAIKVQSSYVLVEGFSIVGNRDKTSQSAAVAQQHQLNNPATSGIGIAVGAPWNAPNQHPHHVVIRGNRIEKCPGSGIGTVQVDYLLIENNIVSGNAWWSPYGNSGISMYQNYNSDQSTGYKMIVRGNLITDTYNKIPSAYTGVISDGNGIIVDDSRNTQNYSGSPGSPYKGRTLIDSNLVYGNGGRGINVFTSDHVDIVNNTTYQNSIQNATPEGEISMVETSDINLVNNILAPLFNRPALTRWNGSDSTGAGAAQYIASNLVWGGTGFNGSASTNKIGVDPQFLNVSSNDFRIASSSPAIDAALSRFSFSGALFGAPRPLGNGPDIGAHEMQ